MKLFLMEGLKMYIFIVSIAVLIALAIFLLLKYIRAKTEYRGIHSKYKDIIHYDEEIVKRKNEVTTIVGKQTELEVEYEKQKTVFDELQKEIALTEETIELHTFGIYKPHYTFATSEEYKNKIEDVFNNQKTLVKNELAAICTTTWTINGSKTKGAQQTKHYIKIMLRAFNGECDASILKVKWNNVTVMEERISKAFEAINRLGTTHSVSITNDYLELKLQELRLAYEYEIKLNQEKEEQKRIKEQMREEEKAQREIEQAQKEADDEEKRYQKALDKARTEVDKAKGEELDELNGKIGLLEQQLKDAQEKKARAISRAQLTKSGHVYIISNIGSFGDNIYKIGMTRRLEPLDRVKELSDASVPFEFDVHALAYSENAPDLEYKLQEHFYDKRVNMVNDRKEFFSVTMDDLELFAKQNSLTIQFTKLAEAQEYRETLALREKSSQKQEIVPASKFPDKLVN
jgi:peptidoglycan hydrolase CwlO-like protein